LSLADFFRGDREDYVAFQAVTMGPEISRYERRLFEAGDYQKYLLVHGMGVEAAEALAEYWHLQIRREWGIDDQEPASLKLLFSAKYRGARFSFGYPACPNLEDQKQLFELLEPQRIGLELTEEWMLSPEQSTTALITHHPQAKYFNVR
jgi:5-methyltetrahydrofolate--homocysteine methyltransferase